MSPISEDEARTRMHGITPGQQPSHLAAHVMREGRRRNRRALALAAVAAVAAVGLGFGALSFLVPAREGVPISTPSASTPSAEPSETPAGTPTAPPTPRESSSGTPSAVPTAAAPRTALPAGFTLFEGDTGVDDTLRFALRPCGPDVLDTGTVPGLVDEQVATWSSETGESAENRGAFVFTDAAAAASFVADFRARAQACSDRPFTYDGPSGSLVQHVAIDTVQTDADEGLSVSSEFLLADGSPAHEDAAGRVWFALRTGNVVVIDAGATIMATPITDPASNADLANATLSSAEDLLVRAIS